MATYAYDLNGKVVGVGFPSGNALTYTRTDDGLITNISYTPKGATTAQTAVGGVLYEPYGKMASLTYGNGLTLTRTHDQDYELSGIETAPSTGPALLNETFTWQTDGRIASVGDNLVSTMGPTSRTAAYTYAPTGRLATGNGPWGSGSGTWTWGWDASGGLTAYNGQAMSVATGSNQLSKVTQGSSTVHAYTWLTGGELTQDVAGATTYAYTYNAARRLTEAQASGSETGGYQYDWSGKRVWRYQANGGWLTAYTFDAAGRPQSEAAANTGSPSREYIWLDDELVGQLVWSGGAPSFYAVTMGQNGEPQLMTGPTGAVAWNGYLAPGGQWNAFQAPTLGINQRYPGQWDESEISTSTNGTYDNGQRIYQAYMGRYLSADPLGIDAGPNPYAYVDGDPLNLTDPEGLKIVGCKTGDCPSSPPSNDPSWRPDSKLSWPASAITNGVTHKGQICFEKLVGGRYLHCCYNKDGQPIYTRPGSSWEDYDPATQFPQHVWEWIQNELSPNPQ